MAAAGVRKVSISCGEGSVAWFSSLVHTLQDLLTLCGCAEQRKIACAYANIQMKALTAAHACVTQQTDVCACRAAAHLLTAAHAGGV
jgi:hypothetical protein